MPVNVLMQFRFGILVLGILPVHRFTAERGVYPGGIITPRNLELACQFTHTTPIGRVPYQGIR